MSDYKPLFPAPDQSTHSQPAVVYQTMAPAQKTFTDDEILEASKRWKSAYNIAFTLGAINIFFGGVGLVGAFADGNSILDEGIEVAQGLAFLLAGYFAMKGSLAGMYGVVVVVVLSLLLDIVTLLVLGLAGNLSTQRILMRLAFLIFTILIWFLPAVRGIAALKLLRQDLAQRNSTTKI